MRPFPPGYIGASRLVIKVGIASWLLALCPMPFALTICVDQRYEVSANLRAIPTEYTEMITEAREEAMNRMLKEAKKLKADAIINVRMTTSQVASGAAELLVYGTAVRLGR